MIHVASDVMNRLVTVAVAMVAVAGTAVGGERFPLPGAGLSTPVRDDSFDPAACAVWDDGHLAVLDQNERGNRPGWFIWTQSNRVGHSGITFGRSKTAGARHPPLGFPGAMPVGSGLPRRNVRVRCSIPAARLAFEGYRGEDVRDRIARASEFARRDPYRGATHNKGIMNGVDPVVIATGNDWRAVEAGAHAYAARGGRYGPLCTWRRGDDGALVGAMELPIALGTVGGTLRVHDGARFGLEVASVDSAQELAMLAACVGVASNLAALRALATDGIQRGHMALHARSVAIAAGARGDHVEQVARRIHGAGTVSVAAARDELRRLTGAVRASPPPQRAVTAGPRRGRRAAARKARKEWPSAEQPKPAQSMAMAAIRLARLPSRSATMPVGTSSSTTAKAKMPCRR